MARCNITTGNVKNGSNKGRDGGTYTYVQKQKHYLGGVGWGLQKVKYITRSFPKLKSLTITVLPTSRSVNPGIEEGPVHGDGKKGMIESMVVQMFKQHPKIIP